MTSHPPADNPSPGASSAGDPRRKIDLHLVSDATGDTVRAVARACMAQFDDVEAVEHTWVLVRSKGQLQRVIEGISARPGPVLCTVVDEGLRDVLADACQRLQLPFVELLGPAMGALSTFLGLRSKAEPGKQHMLDSGYFDRIEAMNYTLAHDDGQSTWNLDDADVILVGVSRTSKTPTCIYLANRGLKAANVPYVPGVELPRELLEVTRPMVVALTVDAGRLVQVRRNRLLTLKEDKPTDYVDPDRVQEEIVEARRFYARRGWPIIDVTRRSIEETAASIYQLYRRRHGNNGD